MKGKLTLSYIMQMKGFVVIDVVTVFPVLFWREMRQGRKAEGNRIMNGMKEQNRGWYMQRN
jgi:hypothetical protein